MSSPRSLFLLVPALTVAVSCGASEGPAQCRGPDCYGDDSGAAEPCPYLPCPSGHACLASGECSPECGSDPCPAGAACSSATGNCDAVACSTSSPCPNAMYCDESGPACYPSNGSCGDGPCPPLNPSLASFASLGCSASSFCELQALPPAPPSDFSAPETVGVVSPVPGEVFDDRAALQFTWRATSNPTLLLVLTAPPQTSVGLSAFAIWGDARGAGVTTTTWDAGVAVHGGSWGGAPGDPPKNVPLYFYVEEVSGDALLGQSAPVPFSVGASAWLATGDSCADSNAIPGTCASPTLPRMCYAQHCSVLCASTVDCFRAGLAALCGAPIDGLNVRLCGVN